MKPALLLAAAGLGLAAALPQTRDSFGPCSTRPSVGDKVLINSVDPDDSGDCVQERVKQVGTLFKDDQSGQPFAVNFNNSCATICANDGCGTDCPICQHGGGTEGNGCNGCSKDVACSGECWFRQSEVWCTQTPPRVSRISA